MSVDLFLSHRPKDVKRIQEAVISDGKREYVVADRIGSGGNAVVHLCTDRATGEALAIKFQINLSEKRVLRFKREVELLRTVKHDQLISLVDSGVVEATNGNKKNKSNIEFLVMPLADSSLAEFLSKSDVAIPYEDYIAQFKGLAGALAALHQDAVHRDIKPENILIRGETWLLSDLGLFKCNGEAGDITDIDEQVGPRYWMSPEAINRAIGNHDEIEKCSDVYQLCSVFWFVVTRRHPTGCLAIGDWTGPKNVFEAIYPSLSHDRTKRPCDGAQLQGMLERATLENQTGIPMRGQGGGP
jgi:serine/threonine protein kinase